MSSLIKKEINGTIRKIQQLPNEKIRDIEELLNQSLSRIVGLVFLDFKSDEKPSIKQVKIAPMKSEFNVNYGRIIEKQTVTFAKWILELPKMIKRYILAFQLLKEGVRHYLNSDTDSEYQEVEEVIINIITILYLIDIFDINSYDNPLTASIRSRIWSSTICNRDYHFWDALLQLLFAKKISYKEVTDTYKSILQTEDTKLSVEDIVKSFSQWVFETTVREEDVISPIYLNERLIDTVDQLLDMGYVDGTSPNIAIRLKKHSNTIRNQIQYLSEYYSTFWRPELNLEKLNLHNYFLKIQIKDSKTFDQINKLILKIPYIRTLFHGKYSEEEVIYSPTLICPHIIANNLSAKLYDFKKKGLIEDFTVQIVREKKHFATITDFPLTINEQNFKKLSDGSYDKHLKKYLFSHSKKTFSNIIEDEVPIDYNLLFFLSILRTKFLLRSRCGVWVNELPAFYERNKITSVDVNKQTDFINQIEIRARKRGFLAYDFFIRSLTRRSSDILIIEFQDIDSYPESLIEETVEKLRVFSFLGQITLHDRIVLTIPGVSHQHFIKNIIEKELTKAEIKSTFYTLGLAKSKFIPFHDLYDYDEQKWKIIER